MIVENPERKLKCDMRDNCHEHVSHIDVKGFIYCRAHGLQRKQSVPCRQLKESEAFKLTHGQRIRYR